jgi:peptidoglycan hydrolase-like protein with peptidoglycan-binding domain
MQPDRRGGWILAALLLLPLAAGLTVAVVALSDSPLESSTHLSPLVGVVDSADRADTAATTVTVHQPEEFTVASQSYGVVVALSITAGAPLTEGQVVMVVSGQPVIAYVAPAPLYRDIAQGIKGPDVVTAQTLLSALAYLDGVDGDAGPATARAIARFNRDHGRADDGSVLRTASLLWVPADSSAPVSVSIRVGADIAAGSELFRAVSGHPTVTVTSDPIGVDRILSVAGVSVTLPAGESTLGDGDDVAAVTAALQGQTSGPGSLSLAQPRHVGTLPAAAVVTDDLGRTCYFSDADGPGIVIDASQGWLGEVDVDPSLIGTPVLLNPRDVRTDLSCGS